MKGKIRPKKEGSKGRTILIVLAAFVVIGIIIAAVIPKGSATQTTTSQQSTTTQQDTQLSTTSQDNRATIQNGIQEVTLSLSRGNYVVAPSTLKAGVPVKMTVDLTTVTGCTTDIVIPALGVRKRVSPGDNVITFTPIQTGTIKMSCSMGMAQGSFAVVAEQGQEKQYQTAPAPQTQNIPSGGSCGMKAGSGGCGCGAR
jgi:hypothetical protein